MQNNPISILAHLEALKFPTEPNQHIIHGHFIIIFSIDNQYEVYTEDQREESDTDPIYTSQNAQDVLGYITK